MERTETTFHVAALQMVSGVGVEQNLAEAAALIAQAAKAGARLIALPEFFCLMGRHESDKVALGEPASGGPLQRFLKEQAQKHAIWLIGGSIPIESPDAGRIMNACLVHGPNGSLLARYDKIHLFSLERGAESFDESRTIRPGREAPQSFSAPCGKVGLSICYDLRFPELYRALGQVELIVVPSAFTHTTGQAHWEILLRARAIENQCYVLAPAQGGLHENGRRTWGHTMLIDPWGHIIDEVPEGPGIAMGHIEQARLAEVRRALPALKHRILP